MGIGPFHKDDDWDYAPTAKDVIQASKPLPNPNPKVYELLDVVEVGTSVVVKVKYPDCTNYEGIKILVYRDTTLNDICTATLLDPHFCELPHPYPVPFARFEPTQSGFRAALLIAEAYSNG